MQKIPEVETWWMRKPGSACPYKTLLDFLSVYTASTSRLVASDYEFSESSFRSKLLKFTSVVINLPHKGKVVQVPSAFDDHVIVFGWSVFESYCWAFNFCQNWLFDDTLGPFITLHGRRSMGDMCIFCAIFPALFQLQKTNCVNSSRKLRDLCGVPN